jgi:tRNA G37 N-methylase Trm5
LGSYEAELHPVLNSLDLSRYTKFINIGSAEGYYAVGLARLRPQRPVYAFDVNPYARRSLKQIAAVNNVRSIVQGGYCTASQLQEFTQQCALVICDIEGYESELLDPAQIGNLRNADILVEIHPHQALSLTDTQTLLISRFAQSHHVTALQATSRPLATWQALCGNRLSPAELAAALNEHRSYPDQSWLWLKAQQ